MIASIFLTLFVAYEVAMRRFCVRRYTKWPWLGFAEGIVMLPIAIALWVTQ